MLFHATHFLAKQNSSISMATRNTFNCLTDFTSDDPSLLISDRLRSLKSPKSVQSEPTPRSLPLNKCRQIDDRDGNRLPESGFRRKFGMSEDGEIGKDARGGNSRRAVNGGPKRSFLNNTNSRSRLLCGPGREFVDQESEDSIAVVCCKHRHYDHRGLVGRGLAKKKAGTKKERSGKWGWVDFDFLDHGDKGLYEALDCLPEKKVIRSLTAEKESDNKTMTLDQYGMVMEEKRRALQAVLMEIAADNQEEEDFLNEFVIIDKEVELDDFLLV